MSKHFFTTLLIVLTAGTAHAQAPDCTPDEADRPGCQWPNRRSLNEQLERSKRVAPQVEESVAKALRNGPAPRALDLSFAHAAEEQSAAELACHTRLSKRPTNADIERCKEVGRAAAASYLQGHKLHRADE
ncbi:MULTISPECIES: hypothetical protein [unclassified Variovorax]|uniref:hypothetical protein n=1 Tax=unclassified Variovorax TaxID=663243 RepID=UPI0011AEF863|nr:MULTISPECIES: hypothetical protein [unclassified Variovorax]